MRRVAVYAGTRNVYDTMATAAKSLAIHTEMDRIILLMEDDVFPLFLPDYVETINVSGQTFFGCGSANYDSHWTYMTLMRTALTKLLPDEDAVLWLDIDTIVEKDISELFGHGRMAACRVSGTDPEQTDPKVFQCRCDADESESTPGNGAGR